MLPLIKTRSAAAGVEAVGTTHSKIRKLMTKKPGFIDFSCREQLLALASGRSYITAPNRGHINKNFGSALNWSSSWGLQFCFAPLREILVTAKRISRKGAKIWKARRQNGS